MFGFNRVVIGDGERGLMYRNRQFRQVLMPGVYRWFDPLGRIQVEIYDIAQHKFPKRDFDILVECLGAELDKHFVQVELTSDQAGMLRINGKVESVLPPGSRALYWRGPVGLEVEPVELSDGLELPRDVCRRLNQLGVLGSCAVVAEVPTESVGLLMVGGSLQRSLKPGVYAFWNFQRNVKVEVIDMRVQSVEVSGQELLTRDKVSLRVNLAASMRVIDPEAARMRVAKFSDQLYRELQYGLRKAVSAKTLDELLGDKASLDADIFAYVRGKVVDYGIEVLGVGVKDVILPGEMRDILNSVVQAEKAAQANVIRRREESNATRSLLNTARLIEDSPTLMRLKELEALEKVTEKIDSLTVFGGLDGVLRQLVELKTG